MIGRALEVLIQVKNKLKHGTPIVLKRAEIERIGYDQVEEEEDFVDDGEPLTWAEQRNIRKELRRFQLWHALRMKVPKGFEEGV